MNGNLHGNFSRKFITPIVVIMALVVQLMSPMIAMATGPSRVYRVQIDTINGNVPTTSCFISPKITLQGSGSVNDGTGTGFGHKNYKVQIDWGDDTPLQNDISITVPSGTDEHANTFTFSFAAEHLTTATSSYINVRLYHGGVPGNDGAADAYYRIDVCVAPPTLSVLNVKKQVINNDLGDADPSEFNLFVKQGSANVAESPFNGSYIPGKDFVLSPGTYIVSELKFYSKA